MPRRPRIHFPGAIYHVITRGNNQDNIFPGRKDKLYYLEKLKELQLKFDFSLLIFAVMDNHSHKVMQVGNVPLSKIMHHLQQAYAVYYNREYKQSGHVFENRYKAYLCDNDRYLLALLRYIHLNPVTANITPDLDYPWSSHDYYAGKKTDGLVDTTLVNSTIHQGQDLNPSDEYLRFMEQTTKELPLPGYLSSLPVKPTKTALTDDDLTVMIDNVIRTHKVTREQFFSNSKAYALTAARKELILTLHHQYHWTNTDIALLIKVSQPYVCRVIAANLR